MKSDNPLTITELQQLAQIKVKDVKSAIASITNPTAKDLIYPKEIR